MATIDTDLQTMLDDCHAELGNSVTLRRKVEGAMNTTTLVRATTDGDTTVTAIRSEREMGPAGGSGGAMAVEITYRVRASQLANIPAPGDSVVDGGVERPIARVARAANDKAYDLVCRDLRKSA